MIYIQAAHSSLDDLKDLAQIASYAVAAAAAWFSWRTYQTNSQRERAKWAVQLFEKFYEENRYSTVREAMDCNQETSEIEELVRQEKSEFTDYLNFFELVCYLSRTDQLRRDDVLAIFDYYLRCLKRHPSVADYIRQNEHGFEHLNAFLRGI